MSSKAIALLTNMKIILQDFSKGISDMSRDGMRIAEDNAVKLVKEWRKTSE